MLPWIYAWREFAAPAAASERSIGRTAIERLKSTPYFERR
jgi:hypothetical protein